MTENKINISWDDLQSRKVDNRLREQQAMDRNRAYAQMQEDALPKASTAPSSSLWNSAIFSMAVFGLLGGILAWGAAALVHGPLQPRVGALLHYDPMARANADKLIASLHNIEASRDVGRLSDADAKDSMDEVAAEGRDNAYFTILSNSKLPESQRQAALRSVEARDRFALFQINVVEYGLCGLMIAMCLAVAEPLTQHKFRAALISGIAGAALGILGGVAAALLSDRISAYVDSVASGQVDWVRTLAMHAAVWGALGSFLGLGAGLVMRSAKKVFIGLVGGLLGGAIGGALLDPVQNAAHNPQIGRLVALAAIGLVAGLAGGWIEDVAKSGWLKVTTGIIAGKQFILYRSPTYIGSAPDCQIYLFKDPQVGKRHAAIHLLPTGIEIEDLPLGAATRVNGKPVSRAKLKNGDTIEVGKTAFCFQEKRPTTKR